MDSNVPDIDKEIQLMDIMDLQTEVIPAGCNDAAIHPWVFVPIFVFIPAN